MPGLFDNMLFVWLVLLIVFIRFGVMTPSESGAFAVFYALFVGVFIYKELNWKDLPKLLSNVVNTLCLSFSLIAAAAAFGYVLAFLKVPALLTNFLISVTDNKVILLLLINLMLLFLGCIMDMAPIIFIVTPILLPVVRSLGMDPVQFGAMMILNLAVGLCTPGKISIERVVREMLPMYLIMFAVLMLVTFVPAISTWLPNLMMG